MAMFSARQVAAVFGVSKETVRTWSETFADYLSPLANPGRGRARRFNDDDMAVFQLVADLKDAGQTYAEVEEALRQGERGSPPDLAPGDLQSLITSETEKRLMLQLETLQKQLVQAYQERDRALAETERLRQTQLENAGFRAKIEALELQLEEAKKTGMAQMEEIKTLQESLGQLRGEMKYLLRGRQDDNQ
jgi:DNA-binding transcriptional MerR regulator